MDSIIIPRRKHISFPEHYSNSPVSLWYKQRPTKSEILSGNIWRRNARSADDENPQGSTAIRPQYGTHYCCGHYGSIIHKPQLPGRQCETRGNNDAVQNSFVALYCCNWVSTRNNSNACTPQEGAAFCCYIDSQPFLPWSDINVILRCACRKSYRSITIVFTYYDFNYGLRLSRYIGSRHFSPEEQKPIYRPVALKGKSCNHPHPIRTDQRNVSKCMFNSSPTPME
jgi:hypothetical protein